MARLTFLLLTFFVIGAAQAKVNLNPEFGSLQYRANSVFSPDQPDPRRYMDEVLVIFHGFMSAIPNSTYKRIHKQFFESMTVIGVNYDALDVPATVGFLETVKKKYLRGRKVTVLGTSLGGFWAVYFGDRIGAQKVVLLNPVVDPGGQLEKYVGKVRLNPRRDKFVRVTRERLDGYGAIHLRRAYEPRTLLILTANDELVDPYLTRKAFENRSNVEMIWYPTGGHTINLRKHPAMDRIKEFIRSP
jgi:predicted esterase YcpF (UPF0227 family)